jgi:hypothetical protein
MGTLSSLARLIPQHKVIRYGVDGFPIYFTIKLNIDSIAFIHKIN